jgi:hypothetical protein
MKPDGEWNAYINETFIATETIGYPEVRTLNINSLGKPNDTATALLTAELDDFRFYNVPLSDDDILALYNKTYDKPIPEDIKYIKSFTMAGETTFTTPSFNAQSQKLI